MIEPARTRSVAVVAPLRGLRSGARALALAALLGVGACGFGGPRPIEARIDVADGDPALGPALMRAYGCVACHTIPGVRGADTFVGPPLTAWSRRAYIAGLVPNTPENLVAWIHDPHLIHDRSAMPNVGLSPDQARHIAAYLYTLR
jgi:mono/diheme cytochrome c family protein